MSQQLVDLIRGSSILIQKDKDFILLNLDKLSAIDKLKLTKALELGSIKGVQEVFNKLSKLQLTEDFGGNPSFEELKNHARLAKLRLKHVSKITQQAGGDLKSISQQSDNVAHWLNDIQEHEEVVHQKIPEEQPLPSETMVWPSVQEQVQSTDFVPNQSPDFGISIHYQPNIESDHAVVDLAVDEQSIRPATVPADGVGLELPSIVEAQEITENDVAHQSILSNLDFVGNNIILVNESELKSAPQAKPFIEDITNILELTNYDVPQATFDIRENPEYLVKLFGKKIRKITSRVRSVDAKRGFMLAFMESPLFNKYINTGLIALQTKQKHDVRAILNYLSESQPNEYLNAHQFKYAGLITAEVRALCAI